MLNITKIDFPNGLFTAALTVGISHLKHNKRHENASEDLQVPLERWQQFGPTTLNEKFASNL